MNPKIGFDNSPLKFGGKLNFLIAANARLSRLLTKFVSRQEERSKLSQLISTAILKNRSINIKKIDIKNINIKTN